MIRRLATLLTGIATLTVGGVSPKADTSDDLRFVAPDSDTAFEVHGSLSGTHYSISDQPARPDTSGNSEALSMNLIAFGTPLHDDDSPYSLQAFEQRKNTFALSATSGRFDTASQLGGMDLRRVMAAALRERLRIATPQVVPCSPIEPHLLSTEVGRTGEFSNQVQPEWLLLVQVSTYTARLPHPLAILVCKSNSLEVIASGRQSRSMAARDCNWSRVAPHPARPTAVIANAK